MTARLPEVSVVIPSHNAAATLGTQLDALARQETDRSFEVLVVDNRSTDLTAAVAKAHESRLPCLRVIDAQAGAGVAYARNTGAAQARGNLLLFCDADDEVAPGWVGAMTEALGAADLVGGAIEVNRLNTASVRSGYPDMARDLQRGRHQRPFASGCNIGIRREAFERLGGFEQLSGNAEDQDLSIRLQLAGLRLVFAPEAVVHYRLRPGLMASARQHFHYGRSDVRLQRRFPELSAPPAARDELTQLLHLSLRVPKLLKHTARFPWVRAASVQLGRWAETLWPAA